MKNKSDVSLLFPQFKAVVEKHFQLPVLSLYSDNGGEFLKLCSFLTQNGISHFTTPAHTPKHNATAERRHHHIIETAHALLHHAKLPFTFWSFACQTATYLINRMPTQILQMQSPFQKLHNKSPNYLHLHSFGCLCFPWLHPYAHHKLQPRSNPCIFIGYSSSQYAYHYLDPITNKIYTSRHVSFFDNHFPYPSLVSNDPSAPLPIPNTSQPPHLILPLSPSPTSLAAVTSSQTQTEPMTSPCALVTELQLPSETTSGNESHFFLLPSSSINIPSSSSSHANKTHSHSMVTRSKNNIFKPKRLYAATKHPLLENLERSSVREAMRHAHWRCAMAEEFNALLRTGTWTLVAPPSNQNVVGCKWIFRIKRNPDGSIFIYKACLVAKGFTQTPGEDFHETLAPVIRPQIVKVILTLALGNSWPMHQLDVNNAFLPGSLSE